MDEERLVVEVQKYELYDQSSRSYKDNARKDIAWRAIGLEIGSSGEDSTCGPSTQTININGKCILLSHCHIIYA